MTFLLNVLKLDALMATKKLLFTLFTCALFVWSLPAQLSLAVSDITGEQGQIVDVDISISGFTDISSMQFSVNWDSTVLDFRALENISDVLPDFSEREIGLVETASGAVRVAWFDNTLRGVTIPDNTRLLTLKFELIGTEGTNSAITITDSPIVIEFTNLAGEKVELSAINGGVITIPDNTTSTTFLTAPNGVTLHQNEPNPFKVATKIKAIFPTVSDVQFFITDIFGKIVHQNNFTSVQGENTIIIERSLLGVSGTYYYTLQSEHYQLSRKMILVH